MASNCRVGDNINVLSCKYCRGPDGPEGADCSELRPVSTAAGRIDQLEAPDRAVGGSDGLKAHRVGMSIKSHPRSRPSAYLVATVIACLLYLQQAFDMSDKQVVWPGKDAQQSNILSKDLIQFSGNPICVFIPKCLEFPFLVCATPDRTCCCRSWSS